MDTQPSALSRLVKGVSGTHFTKIADFRFFSRFTLILTPRPHIRFPSVKPDVCRQPPSDSALWRTSLALAVTFPTSLQFSDLHPLVHVHAGHQKKGARSQTPQINNYLCHSNFKIFLFALSMTCVSNEAK